MASCLLCVLVDPNVAQAGCHGQGMMFTAACPPWHPQERGQWDQILPPVTRKSLGMGYRGAIWGN